MSRTIATAILTVLASVAHAQGFDRHYEVRYGDFNSNGLTDLYVLQEPQVTILHGGIATPIVLPPPVAPFVLQQVGQSFELISALTLQQNSTLSSWPEADDLWPLINDFNIDGQIDLMLYGIASVVPNSPDQIVFSDAGGGPVPNRVMVFGDSEQQFVRETRVWSMNNNYFFQKALEQGWYDIIEGDTYLALWPADYLLFWQFTLDSNGERLVENTEDPFDQSTPPNGCAWVYCEFTDGVWWLFVAVQDLELDVDYSHFHPQAMAVADVDEQVANGTLPMRAIVDLFETVLGPIPCIGVDDYLFTYEDPDLPEQHYIDGHCAFLTIARYFNGMLGEGLDGTGPLSEAELGVHLRSRWVGGDSFAFFVFREFGAARSRHLSVHFPTSGNNLWITAFPSDSPSFGDGGNLVSCDKPGTEDPCKEDYNSDSIANTAITALVDAPPPLNAAGLWQEMEIADSNYGDNLVYCARPEEDRGAVSGTCTGYNSNSLAIGLVDAVGGLIDDDGELFEGTDNYFFDIEDTNLFPGVSTPVPMSEFNP